MPFAKNPRCGEKAAQIYPMGFTSIDLGVHDCLLPINEEARGYPHLRREGDELLILPPYFRTRAIRNLASARSAQDAVGQRDAA